ncbi:hypothetical protein TL16_g12982 [Triparma laevis f. inornata]|uniref:alpha-1,6-mannosyl-glycoprotein 6-beta-N-acetylglucosaminyltransferase n=1 Tax=Triparma laevis f. inornata TaxID=1714386 RepID=A0A9W7BUK0_9STRA|nr:hypothetical protein TL16_g12982 [Triparma laevis f. inornata]
MPKSLLLFTMDSIKTYSQSASKGGPAGEIIIRKSLTTTLSSLYPNLRISVASSDSEMETLGSLSKFDVYVFDPWTWAGPGWKLRPFITDPSKLFILDFFGSERSYIDKNGGIRGFDKDTNVLTAYPRSGNQRGGDGVGRFLGFYKDEVDPKYYTPSVLTLLRKLNELENVVLHSTLPVPANKALPDGVVTHGHLKPEEWKALLEGATHMLGLGDPLLGPSGLDAIEAGCILVNPIYRAPKRGWMSQHGFIEEFVDSRSCQVDLLDFEQVSECILKRRSPGPIVPKEFGKREYFARVKEIFDPLLS